MKSTKHTLGNFLENFSIGQKIFHPTPRTLTSGDRSLYTSLYPSRHSLFSSDEFAINCGLRESPIHDLMVFHVVFGKTVPEISLNAVANLGYSQGRFHRPVYCGDTLHAVSEVIGIKENSNRKAGIVWVKTEGFNQNQELVLDYYRWVMVRKGDGNATIGKTVIPKLDSEISPELLVLPSSLDFSNYNFTLSGERHTLKDYQPDEVIHHIDGVTIDEAEHILATRLWQNTSKVHFDATIRPDGRRLIYGGHIISMARALSFNGLANAQCLLGINGGSHVNPCFSGDTIHAWSIVEKVHDFNKNGLGAIRLRTFVTKGDIGQIYDKDGKYSNDLLLDFDYWALIPT